MTGKVYFDTIRNVANVLDTDMELLDLTKKLMVDAGYYREEVIVHGRSVIKSMYKRQFNDVLFAKWLLTFEPMFLSVYKTCGEIRDCFDDLVINSVNKYFSWIELDKITSNGQIVCGVAKCVSSEKKRCLYKLGIVGEVKSAKKGKAYNQQAVFNNSIASSSDCSIMTECEKVGYYDMYSSDIIMSIMSELDKHVLRDAGTEVLDVMLYSNRKVGPQSIWLALNKKVKLADVKKTYAIIKNTLKDSLEESSESKYDWGRC